MKRTVRILPLLFLLLCTLLLNGCGSASLKDGFYTAQMSDYSHGWKEYLCIMVTLYTQNLMPKIQADILKHGTMPIWKIWQLSAPLIQMIIQENMSHS